MFPTAVFKLSFIGEEVFLFRALTNKVFRFHHCLENDRGFPFLCLNVIWQAGTLPEFINKQQWIYYSAVIQSPFSLFTITVVSRQEPFVNGLLYQ